MAFVAIMTLRNADFGLVTDRARTMTLYLDGSFGAPFAGEMAAEQLGYFHNNGVKISLQPEPRLPDFTGHVARQNAIGVTSGQRFLLARWRGEPIVAFAASLLD